MKFSIFASAKSQKGEECMYEKWLQVTNDKDLLKLCNLIAAEEDADKRGELKKGLPVVTWQAFFPGRRVSKEAQPSGLFMLDIDHVDNPFEMYSKQVASRVKELGIVFVGMTASKHGLRIVSKCLPTLHTIEECQRWLASNLKVEFDGVCKDWARCSFLVHDSYTYYMDAKAIWQEEPAEGMIYDNKASQGLFQATGNNGENHPKEKANPDETKDVTTDQREGLFDGPTDYKGVPYERIIQTANPVQVNAKMEQPLTASESLRSNIDIDRTDQREGLFGGPTDYKGVPYERIIQTWFYHTGGEPTEGERNVRLYQLAVRLRYITDFNEATMMRIMPRYGLPESEVREIVRHALKVSHGQNLPTDLQETLDKIDKQIKIGGDEENDEIPEIITSTEKVPPLPPLFRQWWEVSPEDFKVPVTLCQLPILGALGSRLRAKYLDGKIHSPSFQVSLEAPQASGKSFLVRLVESELAQMMESDEAEREREREYRDKVGEMKLLNIKINADNKDEILGQRPDAIIRYLPATISVTMLLKRMYNAKGLHCFALAEEIDTVYRAYKRGFSNLSELLRVSFDNGLYGQDYASENSWSGNVQLYYNTLFSGTPKAMRRFYPDVEDGLVSRVLFVTLPDQFGKPMPVWGEMTQEQKRICDIALTRLNEISIQNGEVQPEHMMKVEWLNKAMDAWIKCQQVEAVRTDDRTRDIFCRRSAVVGFRAGMLAWFLWEEKNTPTIRRNVAKFATWVANCMLNQHLLRFNIKGTNSNVNQWEDVYKQLGDTFTRKEAEEALERAESATPVRKVLYKWRLLGIIEDMENGRTGKTGQLTVVKFKKVKK